MTRRGRHPLRAGRLRKNCGFRKKGIAFRKNVWYNSRATRCGCSSVGQSTCLTCKGSLVQVHSSTPLKPLAKAGGFSVIYTLHAVRIPCFGAFVRPRKGGVKALIPEISQYIDLPAGVRLRRWTGLPAPRFCSTSAAKFCLQTARHSCCSAISRSVRFSGVLLTAVRFRRSRNAE